jgi:methyltransferase
LSAAGGEPAPVLLLVFFLFALGLQRAGEIVLSARHAARLRARGAVESGRRHFLLIVFVHLLFPVCLSLEVLWEGARLSGIWPLWLALLLLAQALRSWTMAALGDRWTVGVWILPGEPPVKGGPYHWGRHPGYFAVALELFSACMLFGAWRSAILISILNSIALWFRIRCENRALYAGEHS